MFFSYLFIYFLRGDVKVSSFLFGSVKTYYYICNVIFLLLKFTSFVFFLARKIKLKIMKTIAIGLLEAMQKTADETGSTLLEILQTATVDAEAGEISWEIPLNNKTEEK